MFNIKEKYTLFFLDNASASETGTIEVELKQLVEIGQHPNIINLIGWGFIEGKL